MVDFSTKRLGRSITDLRRSLGLTQKQLADSICTQAQISKVEKGEVSPSAEMIYKVSQKLGIDVNYFFSMADSPRLDFIDEVIFGIRDAIRKRSYDEVISIVSSVKNHSLFQSKYHQQFLLWHQGISEFYLKKDLGKAIQDVEDALNLTIYNKKQYTEREIEILNSLGILYSETSNYEQAIKLFNLAINHFKRLPYVNDKKIKTRLYYNLAKSLTKTEQYEQSIEICENGIHLCINQQSLYLLGELYFQKGYNFSFLGEKGKAVELMNRSILLFKIENNERFVEYVQDEINQLQVQKNEKGDTHT